MIRVKIISPDLKIVTPNRQFYEALALDLAKQIRQRTEKKGVDVDDQKFKPYTKRYRKYRIEKKRSAWPNLSFTGKLMGAIGRGAHGYPNKAVIALSGQEGLKAWGNEVRGREFFNLTKKQVDATVKKISLWLKRRNRLK